MYTCLLKYEIPNTFQNPKHSSICQWEQWWKPAIWILTKKYLLFSNIFSGFFCGLMLAWRTMKHASNNLLLKLKCNNYTLVSIIIDFTFSCSSQGFFCREFHSLLFQFISFIPIPFSVFYLFPNSVTEKRLRFSKRNIQLLCKFQWMIKGQI